MIMLVATWSNPRNRDGKGNNVSSGLLTLVFLAFLAGLALLAAGLSVGLKAP
jgi:hypothetical protein